MWLLGDFRINEITFNGGKGEGGVVVKKKAETKQKPPQFQFELEVGETSDVQKWFKSNH